jgi:hypothetical protein
MSQSGKHPNLSVLCMGGASFRIVNHVASRTCISSLASGKWYKCVFNLQRYVPHTSAIDHTEISFLLLGSLPVSGCVFIRLFPRKGCSVCDGTVEVCLTFLNSPTFRLPRFWAELSMGAGAVVVFKREGKDSREKTRAVAAVTRADRQTTHSPP